jgi:hypothetical protein
VAGVEAVSAPQGENHERADVMTIHCDEPEDVLYIRPGTRGTAEPAIDSLTRKMAAAYRAAESTGVLWRGFHICRCGARSTNTDYTLPGGATTNSLCVHYLAFHRDEVPESELAKVADLASGEAEPNAEELAAPGNKKIT